MSVSTLADFLLARIAEDEEAARRVQGAEVSELLPTAQVFGLRGLMMPAARVLAECEAKRLIVEERAHWYGDEGNGLDPVLQLLALPYADHPDYRQEWRP